MSRLRMEGVHKRFGPTVALRNVSLEVHSGEVHALVGENGAGKSTLMKILSGAYQADEGRLWIDREPFDPRDPLQGRAAGISMIYQELSLAPDLSIEENILLGVEPRRGPFVDWRSLERRAREAMKQLGLENLDPKTPVRSLSIAEQQLVELARAVAVGSRVLVLDEPTSTLTQRDIRRLFRLIRSLREKGYAIVYISHFLEEVAQVCDRFTVLRDGEVVGTGDTQGVSSDELAAMMVGRDLEDLYRHSERSRGSCLLEFDRLSGWGDPKSASLEIHSGEVVGIAGLVGAGRTELLRVLFGLEPVQSGRIRVGAFTGPASPALRWRQGVGLVSEDRKNEGLAVDLSVADNLTMTRFPGWGALGLVSPRRQEEATERWIRRLGIKCEGPRQKLTHLSGGNQQKVALARLLFHDVDVLLLDEPTRGIDVGSKAEIYRLVDELARPKKGAGGNGKGILIVSSYLPELLGVCDRIAVMYRGVLSEAKPASEWTGHEIMVQATGTGDARQ